MINDLLLFSKLWEDNKNEDLSNEISALKKFLFSEKKERCALFVILVNDKIVGFSISEFIQGDYAICHFCKCLTDNEKGIYEYLMKNNAIFLLQNKVKMLNYEQDLGLDNLKYAKNSYNPQFFLKKYIVSFIN